MVFQTLKILKTAFNISPHGPIYHISSYRVTIEERDHIEPLILATYIDTGGYTKAKLTEIYGLLNHKLLLGRERG